MHVAVGAVGLAREGYSRIPKDLDQMMTVAGWGGKITIRTVCDQTCNVSSFHPYTAAAVAATAVVAAAAALQGAAKRLLELRQYSAWVTPASGVLLVSGGTYALLSRLLPSF